MIHRCGGRADQVLRELERASSVPTPSRTRKSRATVHAVAKAHPARRATSQTGSPGVACRTVHTSARHVGPISTRFRYPAWWRAKSAGPSTSPARPRSVPAGTRRIDPAKRSSSPRLAIWKAFPVGRRSIAADPPPPSARANLAKRRSACFHRANACQKARTRVDECATTVRTKRSALMYSEWIPSHVTKTSRTRRSPPSIPATAASASAPSMAGARDSLPRECHPDPGESGGTVRPTCVKRLVRGHGQTSGQGRRRSPSRAQANQDARRGMPTTAQDARRGMPTTATPPLIPLQMD